MSTEQHCICRHDDGRDEKYCCPIPWDTNAVETWYRDLSKIVFFSIMYLFSRPSHLRTTYVRAFQKHLNSLLHNSV
jgi:hypothetical protein